MQRILMGFARCREFGRGGRVGGIIQGWKKGSDNSVGGGEEQGVTKRLAGCSERCSG